MAVQLRRSLNWALLEDLDLLEDLQILLADLLEVLDNSALGFVKGSRFLVVARSSFSGQQLLY